MTDREMEFAAKAAGYVIESINGDGSAWVYERGAALNADGEPPLFKWHPRGDDGDALRLAVRLGIQIGDFHQYDRALAFMGATRGSREFWETGDDPCAATRRAIVRAAADIGEQQ